MHPLVSEPLSPTGRSRRALLAAVAAVALLGGVADAAPKGREDRVEPPYDTAFDSTRNECQPGAVCTGTATASDAGQVLLSSDFSREEQAEGQEFQVSGGTVGVRHRTESGTKQLTVTFTWRVSGAAAAEGESGDIFSYGDLETWAPPCGNGCTVTTDTYRVVHQLSRGGVPDVLSSDLDHPTGFPTEVSDQEVAVTLVYSGDVPRWVTARSTAYTAAVGFPENRCLTTLVPLPTCDTDSGHAGTAHAELDATLLSVTFEEA
jgi:hypothetical protein